MRRCSSGRRSGRGLLAPGIFFLNDEAFGDEAWLIHFLQE